VSDVVRKAVRTFRDEGATPLILKSLRYPLKPLLVPAAARQLEREAAATSDLEGWVDLVKRFNYAGISVESWQKPAEIARFLRMLQAELPRTVLEIGTASGGTLFLLTRVVAPDALLISVDLRHGEFGGGYPFWRAPFYRSFAQQNQRVELVVGNSHEPSTAKRVRNVLDGKAVDFLFVDGDHSYEGVRQDFADYGPLVRSGGLVAFHDIVPGGPGKHGDPGGVPTFWQELKSEYPEATELVEDWEWGSCGIGIIRFPAAI
jgi:cephalosporin hydroxylase